MFRLRTKDGLSLGEIGERIGISRERVRQVLKSYFGLEGVPPAAKARRETRARESAVRRSARARGAVSTGEACNERRARLIETAICLFSERRYADVSIEDIAADAGVATGLLYYHFQDKQGLYTAGLEQFAAHLKEHIQAASDPSAPPLEQLMAGLRAHLEFVEQHLGGYRELLAGAASQPRVAAIIERERRARLELIVEGLPAEARPPSPLLLAALEGWLQFVDGAQLSWPQSRRLDRAQVSELCARVLFAAGYAAIDLDSETRVNAEMTAGGEPSTSRLAVTLPRDPPLSDGEREPGS